MRYNWLTKSEKQPSVRQRRGGNTCFHITPVLLFSFFFCLSCSGVYQHPSTFWSITLQPLGADQATIPHMKGHCCSFHMRHRNQICYKRLQRFGMIMWPWESSLVYVNLEWLVAQVSTDFRSHVRHVVVVLHWSPLIRPTFCQRRIDLIGELTLYPGY